LIKDLQKTFERQRMLVKVAIIKDKNVLYKQFGHLNDYCSMRYMYLTMYLLATPISPIIGFPGC
jgi:hypothetical protein